MIKLPLVDRIKFFVERQFVKGAGFQLLVVAAVIGLMALLGGLALRLGGAEEGLLDAIWWAFLRMTDPGYLGDDEGAWRRVVSTILTISGYVVFLGALVAIMTQWLIARMREFERGLTPVTMRQHVVIMGWTNRTLPLMRELVGSDRAREQFAIAFGVRRLRAVILSENVTAAQAQALRVDSGLGSRIRDVVLRDGSSLEEEAIHRAGCLNAAVVIMPSDFGRSSGLVDADVSTIRSLLSIDAGAERHGHPPPLVVAELQDDRREAMARSAYRGPLELVASDNAISRLLTQNILHPGLSGFYREVLTAIEGNEVMVYPAEEFKGASLKEVAGQFPRAIVLGIVRSEAGESRPVLNAASETRLDGRDKIVLLGRSLSDARPTQVRGARMPALERGRLQSSPDGALRRHRLLILGWNERIPNLLDELASYADHQFEVHLVSTLEVAQRQRAIERYSRRAAAISVEHVQEDFLHSGVLNAQMLSTFSAVLLVASDRLDSAEEADARAIVGHRLIENLRSDHQPSPQVLIELADAANEGLAQGSGAEVIVSPLIVSHLLARIALQPAIRLIFDELFTVGGAEIDFRSARRYGLAGSRDFREMESAVAEQGETLLGVCPDGREGPTVLNPPRSERFELGGAARLCVLTRSKS